MLVRTPLVAAAALLLMANFGASAERAPADELGAGFVSLFDGSQLPPWAGDQRFWRVEEGVIVGETTAENPLDKNTFLVYEGREFGDFELRFSYRVAGFNSGVQYRSSLVKPWVVKGLQADFEAPWHDDQETGGRTDRFSGMFFEEGGRGFMGQRGEAVVVRHNAEDPKKPHVQHVGSVGDPRELAKAIDHDGWNDYAVIANGNVFLHIINGRVMSVGVDLDQANFRKTGILAFQLHGGRPMKIEMKNVRIRPIE